MVSDLPDTHVTLLWHVGKTNKWVRTEKEFIPRLLCRKGVRETGTVAGVETMDYQEGHVSDRLSRLSLAGS